MSKYLKKSGKPSKGLQALTIPPHPHPLFDVFLRSENNKSQFYEDVKYQVTSVNIQVH